MAPRLLGAVLAGGESRRFGRDKAAAHVAGEALVTRAAATLQGVLDEVVVVSSREIEEAAAWRRIPDLRASWGPLAGIEAALEHAGSTGRDGVFVLACDLPLVTAQVVRRVIDALGAAAAVAPERDRHPHLEPLCAAYRCECIGPLRVLLAEGERRAYRLLEVVGAARVSIAADVFMNVNTAGDAALAEATLARRRPVP